MTEAAGGVDSRIDESQAARRWRPGASVATAPIVMRPADPADPAGPRSPRCRRGDCPESCALARWRAPRRVPAKALKELAGSWTSNAYQAGNQLYFQGNVPLAVYFLCAGRVKLVRTECGRRKIVRVVSAPAFLGEASALARVPYACGAEVTEPAVACAIETERFLALVDGAPEAARALSRDLARDLDEIESEIAGLTVRTVRERLAQLIGEEAGGRAGAFRLRESRQELAERLGTSPEIVSRAVAELSDEGLVEFAGRRARVLDAARLRAAARLPAPWSALPS